MRRYLKWLSWRRVYCKIVKQEGTPESLAMGAAIGLFIGFAMPMGGQMITAIPLAFLLKGNKALAVMGTMVTNPYTSTFIYPAQCWLGAIMTGNPLDIAEISDKFKDLFANPHWSALFELGEELLVPFFVGGGALAIATSIPTYYIVYYAVLAHRRRKAAKMERRRQAEGKAE